MTKRTSTTGERPDAGLKGYLPRMIAGVLAAACIDASATQAATTGDSDTGGLAEITVTATKVGETDLQSTALTISALTADDLQRGAVVDMMQLGLLVPNANIVNLGGFSQAFIRGVGNTSQGAAVGGETNVGFYVDGVYLERGNGANSEFFDVERIEVLRGPQGVLYGRNSTAGAVNVITKDPTDELDLAIGVTLGDYKKRRVDVSVAGPIANGVTGRLSGSLNRRDGYVKNLIGPDQQDEDSQGLRGKLKFSLGEASSLTLAGDWYKQRANGAISRLAYVPGATWPTLSAPIPSGFFDANVDLAGKSDDVDAFGFSATLDTTFSNGIGFKSITAYRDYERQFQWDIDNNQVAPAYLDLFDDLHTFSQELQVNGKVSRVSWQVGVFYYTLKNLWGGDFHFDAIIPGLLISPTLDLKTDAWAAYANTTIALTDRLNLSLGARYSDEKKNATTTRGVAIGSLVFPTSEIKTKGSWDNVSPRFVLDFAATEDVLLYAGVSRGFRAGQIADSNPDPFPKQVRPETIWSYEAGVKSTFADGRVRANASVFYYDYKDMQQSAEINGESLITNADSGKVKGAELELQARPIPPLRLMLTLSYLDTEYGDFDDRDPVSGALESVGGNRFRYAPKTKATVGAAYGLPVAGGTLEIGGDATFVGKTYFATTNNPLLVQKSYTVANATVSYAKDDSPWSINAYIRNIGNEKYYRDYSFVGLVPNAFAGYVGDPRNFGVQVVFRY